MSHKVWEVLGPILLLLGVFVILIVFANLFLAVVNSWKFLLS